MCTCLDGKETMSWIKGLPLTRAARTGSLSSSERGRRFLRWFVIMLAVSCASAKLEANATNAPPSSGFGITLGENGGEGERGCVCVCVCVCVCDRDTECVGVGVCAASLHLSFGVSRSDPQLLCFHASLSTSITPFCFCFFFLLSLSLPLARIIRTGEW